MSYAASITSGFSLINQKSENKTSSFSDGSELIPAEVRSQLQREGVSVFSRPAINGATVDREGLTNNYAVEPEMYFSSFPSPVQARQYVYQGCAAIALVAGLILTSAIVS
ncbi:MAG: hypothetical protein HLUCCA11_12290 [Phormidesmis priestleyi Ana]|uniref:Ssl1498 family light-harvesting-like protein n=1 Tax=Phormidesmis priestleyi Ana TaxID=1666911 RepID=A0A0P7ZX16_9CYAN|nr:MAG: hypothetical protein HLUCCA11_12290 [Phormidesmis priestleyi Ana]